MIPIERQLDGVRPQTDDRSELDLLAHGGSGVTLVMEHPENIGDGRAWWHEVEYREPRPSRTEVGAAVAQRIPVCQGACIEILEIQHQSVACIPASAGVLGDVLARVRREGVPWPELEHDALDDLLVSETPRNMVEVTDHIPVAGIARSYVVSTVAAISADLVADQELDPYVAGSGSECLLAGTVDGPGEQVTVEAVSYTHLKLPTNREE